MILRSIILKTNPEMELQQAEEKLSAILDQITDVSSLKNICMKILRNWNCLKKDPIQRQVLDWTKCLTNTSDFLTQKKCKTRNGNRNKIKT